jgi:hypothetical protein
MQVNLCLLVIGDLGETGRISLQTMSNLEVAKVCVAANPSGIEWLKINSPSGLAGKLCLHHEILANFEFKQFNLKSDYSEYRSLDFRILTLLKWDLLAESMRIHTDVQTVLFSDLDIYWFRDPFETIECLTKSNHTLFVQDDASKNRPTWCCTGVMFWKNNERSLYSIAALRNLQKERIEAGEPQDDEDTFNQLIHLENSSLEFERLNQMEYIVGRNFMKMLTSSDFSTRKICFHANYLTGLSRKQKLLTAVDKHHIHGKFPLAESFLFIIKPKLRRIREGIKRRLF